MLTFCPLNVANTLQLKLIENKKYALMTSSNGNNSRVCDPLWGESIGHQWIPLAKASDAELWCFLWCVPEQTVWDSSDVRRHCANCDVTVMIFQDTTKYLRYFLGVSKLNDRQHQCPVDNVSVFRQSANQTLSYFTVGRSDRRVTRPHFVSMLMG